MDSMAWIINKDRCELVRQSTLLCDCVRVLMAKNFCESPQCVTLFRKLFCLVCETLDDLESVCDTFDDLESGKLFNDVVGGS